ncbi:MAG: aminopeptidase P family protein [Rectinemataceae bacterium]
MFDPIVYAARRNALVTRLGTRLPGWKGASGIVAFPGNGESPANYADNCHPFRQDSSWLYFFGIDAPGMAAIIDLDEGKTTLFASDPAMSDLIWTGPAPSAAEYGSMAAVDRVLPPGAFRAALAAAAGAGRRVRYLPPYRDDVVIALAGALGLQASGVKSGADPDLIATVISLREIKEEREIVELEKAVGISVDMHRAVLREARAGWTESQAAALVSYVAAQAGARLSFSTIATTKGEVLHNHDHSRILERGGSFLLDAGAEAPSGYAGDLTTSFPIGARFSPRQADIYRLLLRMFGRATAALAPGRAFLDVHRLVCLELASGLKELGIMKGDPAEAVSCGAHALFMPHGLGHMIGLDVHDMEALGEDAVGYGGTPRSGQFGLSSLRLAKRLVPGMVHSVEPGIYFIPGLIDSWRADGLHREFIDYGALEGWIGTGGMRNEEDWLVTESGARRLGPEFDKSLEAVEAARSGA